jgi:hypothetical protein
VKKRGELTVEFEKRKNERIKKEGENHAANHSFIHDFIFFV